MKRYGCKVDFIHVYAADCAVVHRMIIDFSIRNIGCNGPLGRRWHIKFRCTCFICGAKWNINIIQQVERLHRGIKTSIWGIAVVRRNAARTNRDGDEKSPGNPSRPVPLLIDFNSKGPNLVGPAVPGIRFT